MEVNYFKILYLFCHTSTWICHMYTHVPHPESPSLLPLRTIPLGHPSAPAPSILYHAQNLDWRFFHIWYYTCFNAILPNHPTLSLCACLSFRVDSFHWGLCYKKICILNSWNHTQRGVLILWAAYRNSAWLKGQPCPISSSAIHFSNKMSMLFKMLFFLFLVKHIWFILNLFKASWMGLRSTFVIGKGWLSRKGWLPLWWLPFFSDFPHLVPTLLPACRGKCRRRMLCVYSLWLKMRMWQLLQVVN